MVTLEQKLSLFSKLLQQEVQNEISDKIAKLEDEYEVIQSEHKRRVDKDARHIVEHAEKKGEEKRLELISKARMHTRKQSILAKEKYIGIFIDHLIQKFVAFSETNAYQTYLENLIKSLKHMEPDGEYVVRMTPRDCEKYGAWMTIALQNIGLQQIKIVEDSIDLLGGMIIEEPVKCTRIDLSVQTVINEHKDEIVSRIFAAIGEVGETDEE